MTFPLGSLHSDAAGSGKAADRRAEPASHPRTIGRLHRVPKTPVVAPVEPLEQTMRFQAALLLGGVLWILMVLAMASHDRLDPAFTTSGQHAVPHNWVGQLGAYVSDILQMLLGHSAWWLPLVGLRVWLGALALWMRRDTARSVARVPVPVETASPMSGMWRVWLGLALVLSASCALEWSRLYRHEAMLAGEQAGGVLGLILGQWGMRWLGFNGSGVLWIALLVAGSALALRFSWLDLAERIGQLFDRLRQQHETQREVAQDIRIGEKAAIERERVVEEVRQEAPIEPIPLIIEQPMVDVPKSDRVTKEKQKPLFAEMADGKLPQIDLL
ncbi:DNA translocase FtsK 4TM domain-containing protein, partial [Aquabacterium sp.]|uniref:DNA translocase FtsK 4TM domain-containing protein n=1 Tax=Aquabacterium sp. TaxID=1872578 RepID=UPI0027BAB065